jgi:acetyl esterase/lipase
VRWLRAHAAHYNVDPSRIGVTGGSAGGHLAQFLGVTAGVREFEGEGYLDQSSAVKCVVNNYGPSDFTKSYAKSVDAAEVLPLFFGGNLEQKRREHIVGSPLYWVNPNAAPTLCIHGTEDKFVAFEQAQWLVDRLKASAVEAELLFLLVLTAAVAALRCFQTATACRLVWTQTVQSRLVLCSQQHLASLQTLTSCMELQPSRAAATLFSLSQCWRT